MSRINRTWAIALLLATIAAAAWLRLAPSGMAKIQDVSVTPITSTGAGESGLSMAGDAYSVTCTVSSDAVLYKAVYRGGAWSVEDAFSCTMTATRSPSRCIFPADRSGLATYNAFKVSGTVSSCVARQEYPGQPISRNPVGGGGGAITGTTITATASFSGPGTGITSVPAANLSIGSQASGDILYASSGSVWARLAKGSDGQSLKLAGGLPSWSVDKQSYMTGIIVGTLGGTWYFKSGEGYSAVDNPVYAHSDATGTLSVTVTSPDALDGGQTFTVTLRERASSGGAWSDLTSGSMTVGQKSVTVTFTATQGREYGIKMSYSGSTMNDAYGRIHA